MIVIIKVFEEAKAEDSEEAMTEEEEVAKIEEGEGEEAESKMSLKQVRWLLGSKFHFKLTISRWKLRIKELSMLILFSGENILRIVMSSLREKRGEA